MVEHEDEGEIVEVYIEANVLTDEDSADEDLDVNHLSGNQLRASAEIKTANDDEDLEADFDTKELLESSKSLKWTNKKDIDPANPIFPAGNYSSYADFSPVEPFELFFDDSLFEHAC